MFSTDPCPGPAKTGDKLENKGSIFGQHFSSRFKSRNVPWSQEACRKM